MEHLVGIAKEIIQTPNGIKKGVLIIFELGLTLVLAHWAVHRFAPSFSLEACIQFNWENAGDLIASGLMVILLLMASWFIVLKVIEEVPAFLGATINRLTGGLLRKWATVGIAHSTLSLLQLFNIMRIEKKTDKVIPLANAYRFYEYIEHAEENMTVELEETGYGSTGNRLQGIVLGMFLEYCWFFPESMKRPFIFWGLLSTFCFMVGASAYSRVYLQEIVKQMKKLKSVGKYFVIKQWVEQELRRFRMEVKYVGEGEETMQVTEDDKLIQIVIDAGDFVMRVGALSKIWERSRVGVWKAVLFAQATPTKEAQEYCDQQNGRLAIIYADSEETVRDAFYKHFG
jgi:hypothetical protein